MPELEVVDAVVKWIVMPVAGFVWLLHKRQQDHDKKIAVMETEIINVRSTHEHSSANLKMQLDRIFAKLDNIEGSLRK